MSIFHSKFFGNGAQGGGGPCVLMYQTIEVQPGVYMNVYRSGHGHHQTTNKSTVSKNF